MTTFAALTLDQHLPLVLDGGLATTLEADGHDLSGPLWSARLLLDDPGAILRAHRAFLEAGAEVLLTASYQLSAPGLERLGADATRLDALMRRAVALAREASDLTGPLESTAPEAPTEPVKPSPGAAAWVAGSLGPYGALLADGSEYRGRYGVTDGRLRDVHAPRLAALLAAGPDVVTLETVPSGAEVAVLAGLLHGTPLPAWVSMTVVGDGTRTPEGEPLDEALGPAIEAPEVAAVGVNCCPPELVPAALDRLRHAGLPLVAKPNAGRRFDPRSQVWRDAAPPDPGPWLAAGARLIGGCCGTGPTDLHELAGRVRARYGDR
jgi:homocysteine S-methyltransferase